jgi:hypothetical protein
MQELEWTEISNNEFMESANSQTNYIRVIWNRAFWGDIRARKGTICSKEQWKSTMEGAFLPRYKDGKSWEHPTARNFTLYEYSLQLPSEVEVAWTDQRDQFDFSLSHCVG